MAVDPNTGQTIIPIAGGANLAGYMDPSVFGQVQAGQGQMDQKSALARAMLQQGYAPNSGFGGALAQMVSAFVGMKMLKDSQAQSQDLYTRYAQAQADAQKAKHNQDQADLDAAEKRAVAQAAGIKDSEVQTSLKYAPQTAQAEAAAAAAKADALLPSESKKINLETQGKIAAAQAAAEVANRRGYVVSDAAGQQHIITPQGKEIYETTSPGGGKLTPAQTAQNSVDEEAQKLLLVRNAGASQVPGNATQWVAAYTGQPAESLQGKSMKELADIVRKTPTANAVGNALPFNHQALDSIATDMAINVATMKRGSATEAMTQNEIKSTVSPYKTPEANARILENYHNDVQGLQGELSRAKQAIASRQSPGAGAVPAAQPGPQNTNTAAPLPGVTHVWLPGKGIVPVNDMSPNQ